MPQATLANLLIWHTGTYYLGPVQYLLIAGAVLAVREIRPYPKFGLVAALAVLVLAGGYFGASWVRDGEKRMRTVAGLRDCVLNLPDGSIIGYNRVEAWNRLNYIAHGRRPSWTGEIALVKPDQTTGSSDTKGTVRLDYMIYQPGYYPVEPALISGPTVCHTPDATVYQVLG